MGVQRGYKIPDQGITLRAHGIDRRSVPELCERWMIKGMDSGAQRREPHEYGRNLAEVHGPK